MPELHQSARKHYQRDRLDDAAVLYAAAHVLNSRPLDDEDDPRRWLLIATDQTGRLIELVALIYDDGYELIIHAMKARTQYLDQIQRTEITRSGGGRTFSASEGLRRMMDTCRLIAPISG